jgi:hypothetical protein
MSAVDVFFFHHELFANHEISDDAFRRCLAKRPKLYSGVAVEDLQKLACDLRYTKNDWTLTCLKILNLLESTGRVDALRKWQTHRSKMVSAYECFRDEIQLHIAFARVRASESAQQGWRGMDAIGNEGNRPLLSIDPRSSPSSSSRANQDEHNSNRKVQRATSPVQGGPATATTGLDDRRETAKTPSSRAAAVIKISTAQVTTLQESDRRSVLSIARAPLSRKPLNNDDPSTAAAANSAGSKRKQTRSTTVSSRADVALKRQKIDATERRSVSKRSVCSNFRDRPLVLQFERRTRSAPTSTTATILRPLSTAELKITGTGWLT